MVPCSGLFMNEVSWRMWREVANNVSLWAIISVELTIVSDLGCCVTEGVPYSYF